MITITSLCIPCDENKNNNSKSNISYIRNQVALHVFLSLLISEWLTLKSIQRLVVVVKSVRSSETLERWDFKIECDKTATIET